MKTLEVLHTGPLSLIQDLGRTGYLSSGVGCSGAADRNAFRLANRMVGNNEGAAAVECLLGGLTVRASQPLVVSLTGAAAQAHVDGRPAGHASTIHLNPGQMLRLDPPTSGLRTYLAVRGGIGVEPVLGSRSTDTLSGIGPPILRPGDHLPIGTPSHPFPRVDVAPIAPPPSGPIVLRATLGPREDWFVNPKVLTEGVWEVSPRSDRVGIRLDRPGGSAASPLRRTQDTELPPEGVALGSIQVPPSGQPVLFLADHPVSGGYPVLAVVADADIDRAAQAAPGQQIQFIVSRPHTRHRNS